MQNQNTGNRGNVKMLGEKYNIMIGSKDCDKSHTNVNKNNDEDNCIGFSKIKFRN